MVWPSLDPRPNFAGRIDGSGFNCQALSGCSGLGAFRV